MLLNFNPNNMVSLSLISLALLIRWLVGQFPHSGQASPPLYGDYEAQRHWMEITTNLPPRDWYQNTTDNDLLYWGLDYPPLTAYHMYILGYTSNKYLNGSWLELHKSRGFESHSHKLYMRSTVILSDLIIYIPAIAYYFYKTQPIQFTSPPSTVHKQNVALYTAIVLLYPGQILIDHGHFQYNCVFLGLVVWAIILMSKGRQFLASLMFTLALCYKQMALYYSLPFFWCIASLNIRLRPIWKGLLNILLVGMLVISTFGLLFSPWLHSFGSILQVINRIFPFQRGVFEDKVANFWFSMSIIYKYRNIYSLDQLLKASTIATLVMALPAGIHLLFRPSIRTFKYSLVTTSLVFFLFSFQVHEKTILLPALPILLLIREHPMAANWFAIMSTFSLQPLLIRDGQALPYFVLMIIYTLLTFEFFHNHISLSLSRIFTLHNLSIVVYLSSILGCHLIGALAILVKPPTGLPHIHPTVNALYSCIHFMSFLVFFYYRQFRGDIKRSPPTDRVYLIKKTK